MNGGTRLALGTAQWGMTYGIANRAGQPPSDEVDRMLELGRKRGVELLDTAYAYGEAEKILGAQRVTARGYHVITKTPPLRVSRVGDEHARGAIDAFHQSLTSLDCSRVYGLLVHGADSLLVDGGERIWEALETIRSEGHVNRMGVSVYHPLQLERILDKYPIDIVQLPFSVYDQRFKQQGLLRRLQGMRIEIHARSVFLQGLLLVPPDQLPPAFESIRTHHAGLHARLRERGLTPIESCLLYCLQQPEIARIVVGCETTDQLRDVLDASAMSIPDAVSELAEFGLLDEAVINPSTWLN